MIALGLPLLLLAADPGCARHGFADADGDGIIDREDHCPKAAGPKEEGSCHGCPTGPVRACANIDWLIPPLRFLEASATPTKETREALEFYRCALTHDRDARALIVGHTRAMPGAAASRQLATRRADFVKQWLEKRGVAPERLSVEGAGDAQPIAPNTTDEGRRNNDRVELRPR